MKWKIIADSSCNVREIKDIAENTEYVRVPLTLNVEEKVYIDDYNLNVEEMIEYFYNSSSKVTSACPSPEAYKKACEGAENIIIVTITGSLSGSYNSAVIGSNMLKEEYSNTNIHVIDSKSASGEIDLIVEEINNLIKQNLSFEEVKQKITEYTNKTKLLFILEKVDNLVKNGRLSKFIGGAIGLLNIKLIGQASNEGTLELLHKVRGTKKALSKIVEEMINSGYKGGKVRISHCYAEETFKELKELILKNFPSASVLNIKMSGLCSFYAEKGGIMLGYEI